MYASAGAERPRVLIAGASHEWTARVRAALAGGPLELLEATSGADALARLEREDGVALVVIEALLEDMSGLALCRRVRESEAGASVLVLLLSRWGEWTASSPSSAAPTTSPRTRSSRASWRRACRRCCGAGAGRAGCRRKARRRSALRVDMRKALVEMDGRPISLTWREFEVLRLLAQERGRVVRRAELLGLLLGAPDAASPRLIDTHVKAIRRKLGRAGNLIETVRGVGYRLASG